MVQHSCLAYFLFLEMEAVWSSKTLVGIYCNTRHYITEDNTLHSHYCENPTYNYGDTDSCYRYEVTRFHFRQMMRSNIAILEILINIMDLSSVKQMMF